MNALDVSRLVHGVLEAAGDDEMAHGLEDELHQKVLQAIADGTCEDPAECARRALSTKAISFERWCA